MSEITLNILDAERTVQSRIHGSIGDRVVAALAADPETIVELNVAMGRTMKPWSEDLFRSWRGCVCNEPYDAGVMYVDLAARLIAYQSSYSSPSLKGRIHWHDGSSATDIWLQYQLAEEWKILHNVEAFDIASTERRRERLKTPPLDARQVIYGRLPEFIVCELQPDQGELAKLDENGRYELVKELHSRWLLEPRDDLRGASPRDVLLAHHDHIMADIWNQKHFWSFVGQPPPPLSRDSHAYRFGGFGTHELVLYYDLVRHLFHACIERTAARGDVDLLAEAEHLQMLRQEWMHTPQDELHGRSPVQVIDRERMRLPVAVIGDEAIVDRDCPMYEMMADESVGPTFWNLDGCNMDWEYAFSFHRTREEWEEEQRDYEEFSRKCDERREQEHRQEQGYVDGTVPLDEYMSHESSVWQTSWSNLPATEDMPPWQASRVILFGVGCHLGELCEQLRATGEGADRARSLRSGFTELRHAVDRSEDAIIESLAAGFRDQLESLAHTKSSLTERCRSMIQYVERLVQRCHELTEQRNNWTPPDDDDFPF